ncbi:MAG UNVERIFIED_CONTAM: hypothetical protein LVR18_08535 [Planctomycetaceae bacterium]
MQIASSTRGTHFPQPSRPVSADQISSAITTCPPVSTGYSGRIADTTAKSVEAVASATFISQPHNSGGWMPDFHSMSRLSLIGLLLLQAGCSTTSLRNLFSWNRGGDYHTLGGAGKAVRKEG